MSGGARYMGLEALAHSSGAAEQEKASDRNWDSQENWGAPL